MRTFFTVILTILLIASIAINVWFYTETSSLNATVNRQLGHRYYSSYELPPEVLSQLKSNIGELVYQNQQAEQIILRLQSENQQYRATLLQIQEEAEKAQQYNMFKSLLSLIFSLF